MKEILKFFLCLAVGCLCYALVMCIKEEDPWDFFFYIPFAFIILVFPLLFSVIVFKFFLKKYLNTKSRLAKYIIWMMVLFCIIQGAFFCWTILDMQYFDFDYEYTIVNIMKAYRENYLSFLPASLLVPVTILFLDNKFSPVVKSQK